MGAREKVGVFTPRGARYFEVEFISEVEPEPIEVKADSAISIDLGVDNPAACVDTNGVPYLVEAKKDLSSEIGKENVTNNN